MQAHGACGLNLDGGFCSRAHFTHWPRVRSSRLRSARAGAMRAFLLCVALVMTAGCAPLDAVAIQPAPMAQTDCSEIAAAADQYNAVMQDVVYKNSYNECVRAKLSANFPP